MSEQAKLQLSLSHTKEEDRNKQNTLKIAQTHGYNIQEIRWEIKSQSYKRLTTKIQ